jgi:hypothetical protein
MPNLQQQDLITATQLLSSSAQSSKITVCGMRQVRRHQFDTLPQVRSAVVRQEEKKHPRVPRAYWQERGWRRDGEVYVGSYQVNGTGFAGLARKNATGTGFDFYIKDPPLPVKRSPCFHERGEDWYWVHWHNETAPLTVCSGLMGIERKLAELLHP